LAGGLIHVVAKVGAILGFLAGEEPKAALLFDRLLGVPEVPEINSFGFILRGVLVHLYDVN